MHFSFIVICMMIYRESVKTHESKTASEDISLTLINEHKGNLVRLLHHPSIYSSACLRVNRPATGLIDPVETAGTQLFLALLLLNLLTVTPIKQSFN